jgi:RNA polymerase sigma factor (sigma-70 family)
MMNAEADGDGSGIPDALSGSGSSEIANLIARARSGDEGAWDALVEQYSQLVWSICRKHRLSNADAEDVGQSVWLQLVKQLDQVRDPAALPGWLATTTRRTCARMLRAAEGPPIPGRRLDAELLSDEQGEAVEQEILAAERHVALREAFADLPICHQRLITMLIADPPVPYAEISARLGIAVGSIGPIRARCLDRLRRHPAIAALIEADGSTDGTGREPTAADPPNCQSSGPPAQNLAGKPPGRSPEARRMRAGSGDRRAA